MCGQRAGGSVHLTAKSIGFNPTWFLRLKEIPSVSDRGSFMGVAKGRECLA